MAEYSRLASGKVLSLGGATPVRLPFIPDFLEISNKTAAIAGSGTVRAWWMTNMGEGSAFLDAAASSMSSASSATDYAYVYALIAQSVAIGAPVLFDSNGPMSAGFTHVAGSDQLVVVNAGDYKMDFVVSGAEPNQFAFYVNGAVDLSTVYGSGAGTQQNGGQAILSLVAGDVVTLVNHLSAAAVTLTPLVGGTANAVSASISAQTVAASASAGPTASGAGYIDVIGGTSSPGLVNGSGFTTFRAGLSLQYGPVLNIVSVSKANPALVTTATAHNLVSGDIVIFQGLFQSAVTGMPQLTSMPFEVTVTGATTFTIPWNSNQTSYTIYNNGFATVQAAVKKVLYPTLYAPGVVAISAITLGVVTLVSTTAPHNFVVGQEVAFRISQPWGTTELNSLPNLLFPGSPIYGYVTVVNSPTQVTVNINSSAFTAFNSNPTVAQVLAGGLTPPQILAVGDNNSGSNQFGYNPPLVNGVPTINGPAIAGAFVNNTSMGFIVGPGVAGAEDDELFWRAYMSDMNVPV